MTHQSLELAETASASSWQIIRAEVEYVGGKEPLLQGLLSSLFENCDTLSEAMAAVLVNLFQPVGVRSMTFADLFLEALSDGNVVTAMVRDLHAVRDRDPACITHLHALVNYKGFQALQAYRIAHKWWSDDRVELASWLANRTSLILGPDIHPAARIGSGVMLDHGSGIVIGETAAVEDDVSILQNVTLGGTGKIIGDRHPKVRRGVMVGAGAKVIGNIEIGEFSKIAAGSVVLKSVPASCTVAGIPAKIVRLHGDMEMPAVSMNQNI